MIEINNREIDINFNRERKLQACVVGDGIEYTASIIDREGKVIQSHRFGVGYSEEVPSAEEYLNWFIHNGHRDVYKAIEIGLE